MSERSREAMQAETIVQAEVERFATGQQTLSAVPAIVSLQQSMEEMRQAELRRMQGKLQSLTAEQRNAVEALTRGLINKVLHQPLQTMKAAARNGDLTVVEVVQQIFGLTSPLPRHEVAATPAGENEQEAIEPAPSLEAARR